MSKVAIVTGANQGLALVRGLCRTLGTEGIVYLTARDRKRGEQAVDDLEAEGLSPRLAMAANPGIDPGLVRAAQRGDQMAQGELMDALIPFLGRLCGPIARRMARMRCRKH